MKTTDNWSKNAALAADVRLMPSSRNSFEATRAAAKPSDTDQGGAAHDLRSPELQGRVLHDIEQGVYSAVLLATPCTTFAIAHGYHPDGGRHYGWRSQQDRDSVDGMSGEHIRFAILPSVGT